MFPIHGGCNVRLRVTTVGRAKKQLGWSDTGFYSVNRENEGSFKHTSTCVIIETVSGLFGPGESDNHWQAFRAPESIPDKPMIARDSP